MAHRKFYERGRRIISWCDARPWALGAYELGKYVFPVLAVFLGVLVGRDFTSLSGVSFGSALFIEAFWLYLQRSEALIRRDVGEELVPVEFLVDEMMRWRMSKAGVLKEFLTIWHRHEKGQIDESDFEALLTARQQSLLVIIATHFHRRHLHPGDALLCIWLTPDETRQNLIERVKDHDDVQWVTQSVNIAAPAFGPGNAYRTGLPRLTKITSKTRKYRKVFPDDPHHKCVLSIPVPCDDYCVGVLDVHSGRNLKEVGNLDKFILDGAFVLGMFERLKPRSRQIP